MKHIGFSLFALMLLFGAIACSQDTAAEDEAAAEETAVTTSSSTGDITVSSEPPAPEVPAGPVTMVSFAENEFDFGTVDSGEKVEHDYSFTNTGTEDLIISNAKGSCGCTVPDWPKEPIPPGESGVIKVVFDSKGKKGPQSKRVTITANTNPPQSFLTIKGEVTAAETTATN